MLKCGYRAKQPSPDICLCWTLVTDCITLPHLFLGSIPYHLFLLCLFFSTTLLPIFLLWLDWKELEGLSSSGVCVFFGPVVFCFCLFW